MASPIVALVRYPGQPINVFSVVVEWDGYGAAALKERAGVFTLVGAFEYDRSREVKFIQALAENTVRYQNARSVRLATDMNKALRAVTNVLVPVYS